jgi:molybdopterin synthase sulfur carrier subunit
MATVHIPSQLRDLTNGDETANIEPGLLRHAIDELDRRYPGFAAQIRSGESLAPGIAVSVDGSVSNRGLLTRIGPESEVHFLPALGGG